MERFLAGLQRLAGCRGSQHPVAGTAAASIAAAGHTVAAALQVVLVGTARAFAHHIGVAGIAGAVGIGEKAIPQASPLLEHHLVAEAGSLQGQDSRNCGRSALLVQWGHYIAHNSLHLFRLSARIISHFPGTKDKYTLFLSHCIHFYTLSAAHTAESELYYYRSCQHVNTTL